MSGIGRTDALEGLRTILQLTGTSTSPDELDLAAPISTVVDLMGIAEYGSSLYYGEAVAITTSVATSRTDRTETELRSELIVADALREKGLVGTRSRLWLCGLTAHVQNNEANFLQAGASVSIPETAGEFVDNGEIEIMCGYGNTQNTGILPSITAGVDDRIPIFWQNVSPQWILPWKAWGALSYPARIRRVNWLVGSNGGGSVTVRFDAVYAFCPPGVIPVGYTG